jgi:hypothetical protein
MYTNLIKIPNSKVHKHLSDGSYSKTRSWTDGQTDREADKLSKQLPSHVVTQKDLHMEKTCSCLRNTVIASDKDCYFGTYWPCDFQAVSFQCLLQQY